MKLTLNNTLSLVPIEIRKDKKHFIVEDKNSGEFFEMPEICIEAIRMINNGKPLGEIELHLKKKYPNDEVNLIDFAEQLFELALIAEIDGSKIEVKGEK